MNPTTGALLILGGIAGFLWWISTFKTAPSRMSKHEQRMPDETRSMLLSLIDKLVDHSATCDELAYGMQQARLYNGTAKTVELLQNEYDLLCTIEAEKERAALEQQGSPINDISLEQWETFRAWAGQAAPGTVTSNYNLGRYIMSMRQLQDLGWAKNVRLQEHDGRQVYKGDWISPHSLERFLSTPELQDRAFWEIVRRNALWIKGQPEIIANIGTIIEGKQVTLSGLLGLAKQAGLRGMTAWLKDPASRKEATTKAFLESTGLF